MRPAVTLIAALLSSLLLPALVFAGTQDNAVIALHDQALVQKTVNTCPDGPAPEDPNTAGLPCSQYAVSQRPTFSSRTVYLVVARANQAAGIAGASCGIDFTPLLGMFGWTLCADLDFPNGSWPAAGGGDRITWAAGSNCQQTVIGSDGVHAIAGAFYVYAYGDAQLRVTPNNGLVIPELKVADCTASESDLYSSGSTGLVGYGTELGYSPCTQFDCGCAFGASQHQCCCDGDTGRELDCHGDFCDTGTVVTVSCSTPCSEACGPVAAEPSSWGSLKARY